MDIVIPPVGESITEVVIGQWFKEAGATVEQDEIICELESDKANFELRAETTGILTQCAKEGDTLSIGDVVARIDASGAATAPAVAAPNKPEAKTEPSPTTTEETKTETEPSPTTTEETKTETPPESPEPTIKTSPAAAKVLREANINPTQVTPTGPEGRITHMDAQAAIDNSTATTEKPETATPNAPTQEASAPTATEAPSARLTTRNRLSTLRKTIARRLVEVKNQTAMLTTFNEVNMQAIINLRGAYKESFKQKYDVGLGFMSFFTQAVCAALQEFPLINAKIDGDEVVLHEYCDISIAVSTPKGLVVPVLRDAQGLSFADIERGILRLADLARTGKLSIEQMQGGTFTITNGGIFGSLLSTPIINAPQSAILGMHNIVQRPVVVDGEIIIQPMMYVALSYDHRIIDGRESVSFLVRVKDLLENPARLLLQV